MIFEKQEINFTYLLYFFVLEIGNQYKTYKVFKNHFLILLRHNHIKFQIPSTKFQFNIVL